MRTGAEGPRFATGRERGAEVRNGIVKRYFFTCVSVVLVSIVVLGAVFLGLSAQYFKDERQDQLLIIAQRAAERTSSGLTTSDGNSYLLDFDTLRQGYRLLISTQEDADLFMTDVNGVTVLCTEGTRCAHTTYRVPAEVLEKSSQASAAKGYRGMGTLGEIYKRPHYIVSVPITGDDGYIIGYVFAASPADELSQFLVDVLRMFAIAAVVVLAISFAVIYYTTKRLVSPLKEMAGYAARFGQGDFSQTVPVTSDDEVGQLAMALNNMSSSLAVVEQTRRNFVANVSHELKTPLTSIKGFTDMLASGMVASPEDQKRFITMIGVEVDRLIDLINDILKLSELESVTIPQSEERSDVLTIARDTAAFLTPTAKAAEVTLSVDGGPATVAVPQGRLKELLLNLVGNGIKYNEPGGTVHTAVSVRDGQAVIAVSDTGIGIPPEAQSRVFERFYRVDKGRARKNGGTGLGLAIVKHIVQLYGGTVTLESAVGKGSTFTVTLPLAKDNA